MSRCSHPSVQLKFHGSAHRGLGRWLSRDHTCHDSRRTLVEVPEFMLKSQALQLTIPVLRKQWQEMPGACWPTSLAESVSHNPILKIKQNKVERDWRKTSDAGPSLTHAYMHTHTHMYLGLSTFDFSAFLFFYLFGILFLFFILLFFGILYIPVSHLLSFLDSNGIYMHTFMHI